MRILSVSLSITRVDCDKTVERSVQIYIPYERRLSLLLARSLCDSWASCST